MESNIEVGLTGPARSGGELMIAGAGRDELMIAGPDPGVCRGWEGAVTEEEEAVTQEGERVAAAG